MRIVSIDNVYVILAIVQYFLIRPYRNELNSRPSVLISVQMLAVDLMQSAPMMPLEILNGGQPTKVIN